MEEKEPLSEKILNFIGETSLDILDFGAKLIVDPYHATSYGPRAIHKLKRSPYFEQEGKKLYVTEKGRMKIINNILRNKKLKEREWNGKWLGIIFDIPEANRKERAFLRRELGMAGCKELQKSVWITHLDIQGELMALLKLWKKDFKGDIRFLEITGISGEKELKNYFKVE